MNFELYSQYYDLLYRDKDYGAEAAYIIELLHTHCTDPKYLLELGCGTGKHAELLCAHGFIVHGIELSKEMLRIAASRNIQGFSFEQGDIASYQTSRQYDAVLSLFHVISYLTETDKLNSVLANTFRHLKPGGIFLFDVWHTDAVNHLKPEKRVKEITDPRLNLKRYTTPVNMPEASRVDVHFDVEITDLLTGETHTISELHPMRHFSGPEIEMLAAAHGFKLVKAEEFASGKPPGEETWGVCYILKKPGNG
jgi:SAM-dependent methyltransferase